MEKFISHPLIQENKIEARLYQQLLAADVLKKGNSMIVAPTALGKTVVAALVAADRLNKFSDSKILILAPSKPLVIQHEESFRNFLLAPTTSITGSIKPEERNKRWNDSQIICATPQTVESDLIKGRYSFKNVSALVFDECHRGVGSYAYVYLASRYINESKNDLILGLTASPGSDKDKIKNVCENLFIKEIIVKTEEDSDVSPYFNPIDIDWIQVTLSDEQKTIKKHLNKALKLRLKSLKNLSVIPTIAIGKRELLTARSKVQNRIARSTSPDKNCFRAISLLAASINLQHALELLETQGINTLSHYFTRLEKKKTKAAKGLLSDPDFEIAMNLTNNAFKSGIEHPKLKKLINILKTELKKDNAKIIVFTQFRDTLEQIHKSCQEEGINSVKFFGQGKRDDEKGLTQKEQKNIIKSFKMGNYDVLISTSVAEEGIDIPAVDLVILYEPVPSEIRMIQRRGRTGRKTTGNMKILLTKGTRDEAYYWSSINKEKNMKKELSDVSMLNDLKSKDNSKGILLNNTPTYNDNLSELDEELDKLINSNESENNTVSVDRDHIVSDSLNGDNIISDNDLDLLDIESEIISTKTSDSLNKDDNGSDDVSNSVDKTASNSNNSDSNRTKIIKPKLPEKTSKATVFADSMEGNSHVLRELDKLGLNIIIKPLVTGDYQITDDVCIERKTASDFVSSILDKRLYKQMKDLKDEFSKPLLILEGDNLYTGFINPNAVRGALTAVAIDFGIPILPTHSVEDTAAMIRRIVVREQRENKPPTQVRTEPKPLTLEEQKLFIIESLPNVGPVNARKLLENFGSVENVIMASEDDLQKVEGIGKKIAKLIKKVLTHEYEKYEKPSDQKLLDSDDKFN